MKVLTISERIKSNIINPERLKNMRTFAQEEGMMLKSIPLKDGTAAKILANKNELDCLIMQNGKVVASKGYLGDIDDIGIGIARIFDYIQNRNRAAKKFDSHKESIDAIHKFLTKFDK